MLKTMYVNINKPLHVSVLFMQPSSGGHMPCFVPLLYCLLLICFRWIFTWYVAVCVYLLFVCVCVCSCQWKICLWTLHKQIFHWQEHKAHTQIDDIHMSSQTDFPLTKAPSTHTNWWYTHEFTNRSATDKSTKHTHK